MSTQVPLLLRVHCRPEAGALRRCLLPPVSASVCSDVGAPHFDSDDPPGENTVSQGGRCAWPAGNLASRSASRFQSARLRRACVRVHTRVCARRGAVSGKTQSRGCAPCRAPGLECVTAVAHTRRVLLRRHRHHHDSRNRRSPLLRDFSPNHGAYGIPPPTEDTRGGERRGPRRAVGKPPRGARRQRNSSRNAPFWTPKVQFFPWRS